MGPIYLVVALVIIAAMIFALIDTIDQTTNIPWDF